VKLRRTIHSAQTVSILTWETRLITIAGTRDGWQKACLSCWRSGDTAMNSHSLSQLPMAFVAMALPAYRYFVRRPKLLTRF
jgi:hypothetical protein